MKPAHTDEYLVFRNALHRVLRVSKSDLSRMLADEKTHKAGKPKPGPKPKTSASVRVSRAKD